MEKSILRLLNEKGSANPEDIAAALGITEKNATTFLNRMAEKGTIRITRVEPAV